MIQKKTSGFTLIELLVVISIIALLVAFLLPNLLSARERAADTSAKNKLKQFATALRMYYNDNQSYPANEAAAIAITGSGSDYMKEEVTAGEISYYTALDNGNSFQACTDLVNTEDRDIETSQAKCEVSDAPEAAFCVCLN